MPYKKNITDLLCRLPLFIVTALIAGFGAIVSYLARPNGKVVMKRLVQKWVIGTFVGLILGLLLMCTDMSVTMATAIGGLAGSNAEEILIILNERVSQIVKKIL